MEEKLVAIPRDEYRWITKLAHERLAFENLLQLRTSELEREEAIEEYLEDSWFCDLEDLVESDVKTGAPVKLIQLPSGKYIGVVEL